MKAYSFLGAIFWGLYIVFALRVLKKWKVIQQLARRSSCSVNHHHRLLLPQLRFFYQLNAVPFLGVPAIPWLCCKPVEIWIAKEYNCNHDCERVQLSSIFPVKFTEVNRNLYQSNLGHCSKLGSECSFFCKSGPECSFFAPKWSNAVY